jgi:hypothetical protein
MSTVNKVTFSYIDKNPPLTIMKITLLFMFHVPTRFLFHFHLHNVTIREIVIIIRVIPVLMCDNRSEELKEYMSKRKMVRKSASSLKRNQANGKG